MVELLSESLNGKPLAFVGAGNVTEAIVKGLIAKDVISPGQILASDILEERRQYMSTTYGIKVTGDNADLVQRADVIIVAVKPQVTQVVLEDIGLYMGPSKLMISVVAGVSINTIAKSVKDGTRIIRTIPNTPVTVMAGGVAIASDSPANSQDFKVAQAVFQPVSRVVFIEEKLMDAATGLSGSGPAFMFVMIEALADGGVKMGMTREVAQTLAAQAMLGAAKLFLESGKHPGQLKNMVTSPGGTSIAGVHAMEAGGVRAALMNAVEAATLRSKELGKG
jgi:pyrroline-5-carboxylate reductase